MFQPNTHPFHNFFTIFLLFKSFLKNQKHKKIKLKKNWWDDNKIFKKLNLH
jgi:hypothetical protein